MTSTTRPKLNGFVLFSLIFGEIAHAVKEGMNPFRGVETITLGYEKEKRGQRSTLIKDYEGNWYRLTVEPVEPPTSPTERCKSRKDNS